MEIWDAYYEDGTLAGCDLIRGQEIPEGLYHLVSEVLIRHKDGSYLLMQRDYKKPNYPGLYEASASGSALKGENALFAAKRELKEETGIISQDFVQIYRYKSNDTIYIGYLCVINCDKESIRLQDGETISYVWLGEVEFLKFVQSEMYVQPHRIRLNEYLSCLE